jgi:hypothetical protein
MTMTLTRKNSTTISSTILTYAKRASLVYLIMPSFMLAIALNIPVADAQSEEFILQFGTPEEDSVTAANDVFADSSGAVYVVGFTTGTLPGQSSQGDEEDGDAFIRKYDSDGNEIWARQFGTADHDSARGVSGDSEGGVYVVGDTDGTFSGQTSEGDQDAFIRKYDSDGDEQWTRQFGTSESDFAAGASTDSSGDSVYVVGETDGTFSGQTSEGDQDAFIRKYDSDGNEIWTRQFGTSESDFAAGVSTDSSGDDVYVAGSTRGTLPDQTSEGDEEDLDAFIRKYDSDGDEQWTRQFGTSESDFAAGVSTDSSGDDVYVAGSTQGTLPDQATQEEDSAFIRKYDSDGNEQWTRQFTLFEGMFAAGVSVDSSGDVSVGGLVGDSELFAHRYNSDGDELWTRVVGGLSSEDHVLGVSADVSGVYIVGETGEIDAFLAKLVGDDDDKRDKRVDDDKREKHHEDDDKRKKHHDEPKKKDDDKRRKH